MTARPNAERHADARMNVLQVCKYYYPVTGGMQRVVRSLVTGIGDVDFRVLTARPRGRGGVDAEDGTTVVRAGSAGNVKSTPLSPTFPYLLYRQLGWADLVHYHLPFPVGPVSHLLNWTDDTPVVVTFHDDMIGKGPVVYPYEPVLDRFLGEAEYVIVTSPNMRDECARISKFERKTRVIPIGIDVRQSTDVSRAPRGRELLFVGRLVRFKGVRHLVSAMDGLDATLSVVGEGPERGALERHAADEGVSGKVTFEGYVSEERLTRLYRGADVFVLPSVGNNESFGIVQLEAMKHGLPVVNTALPTGVPFVSVDGKTGITVAPGDPDGIADAVATLLDDPELYRRYSENARRRVVSEFTRDRMLDATEEIYREAVRCA